MRPRKAPHMGNGTHLNITKSGRKKIPYPRISAGPCRFVYVHRLVAEALLRRRLTPNETVDHKDQNSLNPDPSNLLVISWSDHGKLTRHRENGRQLSLKGMERGVDYEIILDGGEVMEREPGCESE